MDRAVQIGNCVVQMPCGAGKTAVGVGYVERMIRKRTRGRAVIVCLNNVTVDQWLIAITRFTTIPEHRCVRWTAEQKDPMPVEGYSIVLTTYAMATRSTKQCRCDLMVLDEVHVAPATVFRKILLSTRPQYKLGLTATLVREDDLIEDLIRGPNPLVGPVAVKLPYRTLVEQGYLALSLIHI